MKEEENKKRKYNVPAVDIAFKILSLLSRKKFNNSNLTEISNALSLNPTTSYRILQQLEELSIVRFDKQSKRYSLGSYLVVLGERAKENLYDLSIIIPFLEQISEETGLTATLIERVGQNRSTIIVKNDGPEFGINVSVGRHLSINDGASGLVFLAYMDREKAYLSLRSKQGLRPLQENEIIEIMNELEQIREDGYSITFDEYLKGIFGIATPIVNIEDKVEMVISVLGLTAQFKKEELLQKAQYIKEVTEKITKKLRGYDR